MRMRNFKMLFSRFQNFGKFLCFKTQSLEKLLVNFNETRCDSEVVYNESCKLE